MIKKIRKHKVISIILSVILVLIISISIALIIPRRDTTPKPKKLISTLTSKTSSATGVDETSKLDSSPSSGPLQYEALDTYYSPNSKIPKFIYVTSEYRDERLIELNDQVISELKSSKKIDDTTTSYSINYFNDKGLAQIYFDRVSSKTTSSSDKQILKNSYIASYIYSQKLDMNRLTKMQSLLVIKQY